MTSRSTSRGAAGSKPGSRRGAAKGTKQRVSGVLEAGPKAWQLLPPAESRPLGNVVTVWKASAASGMAVGTAEGTQRSTYGSRRKAVEDDEQRQALALVTYMRLQPHTGRPCLGLFHLHRRMRHLEDLFLRPTLWHQHALQGQPLRAGAVTAVQLCFMANRVVHASARCTVDHIGNWHPTTPHIHTPTISHHTSTISHHTSHIALASTFPWVSIH